MSASTVLCPPEHAHDRTTVCYKQHRCRCLACRSLNARREAHRQRQLAYGRPTSDLVDAGPVREHLRWLSRHGIGRHRVVEITGVSATTIEQLLYGRAGDRKHQPVRRISATTATAVLQVWPFLGAFAGGGLVPARGAHRRIQALVVEGWSISAIARHLTMTPTNLLGLLERDRVTAAKFREIAALFSRMATSPPPSTTPAERAAVTRARRYAADRGWHSAFAWDDIDRDEAPEQVA